MQRRRLAPRHRFIKPSSDNAAPWPEQNAANRRGAHSVIFRDPVSRDPNRIAGRRDDCPETSRRVCFLQQNGAIDASAIGKPRRAAWPDR